jgi:hypothetical protein
VLLDLPINEQTSRVSRRRGRRGWLDAYPWSAVRNAAHAYGFAAFALDPGSVRAGATSIKVVYYDEVGPDGQIAPFESFTLQRPAAIRVERVLVESRREF